MNDASCLGQGPRRAHFLPSTAALKDEEEARLEVAIMEFPFCDSDQAHSSPMGWQAEAYLPF